MIRVVWRKPTFFLGMSILLVGFQDLHQLVSIAGHKISDSHSTASLSLVKLSADLEKQPHRTEGVVPAHNYTRFQWLWQNSTPPGGEPRAERAKPYELNPSP
jgi:hypothetical protein